MDQETLALFALKGVQGSPTAAPRYNANAVKVRRVTQLIHDLSRKPFPETRIFDLACGEGVYAIEAALRGADVTALDARADRMHEGEKAAQRLGLPNLRFEQADVRDVNAASHGMADVILFLGILYHLDERDVFSVLENLHGMCRDFLVIDTHVALRAVTRVQHDGHAYDGKHFREHAADDSADMRARRLQASIDNPTSFWFTRESLLRLLKDVGFATVCEVGVPLEPLKPADRITLVAFRREPVSIASYPWVNGMPEDEIARNLAQEAIPVSGGPRRAAHGLARGTLALLNRVLRSLRLEIRRI